MTLGIIGGKYRGKKLSTIPEYLGIRPTSNLLRGAIFDITRGNLPESTFLDLYAGSGAIGFEALSQGAEKTILVEKNFKIFKILEKNATIFERGRFQLHHEDSINFCNKCFRANLAFDIIFADPPFDLDISQLFEELRPVLAEKGILMIQFPSRNPPYWLDKFEHIKKYGESSLAIFYN